MKHSENIAQDSPCGCMSKYKFTKMTTMGQSYVVTSKQANKQKHKL